VADKDIDVWPIEDIPNCDSLYMRVHRRWFDSSGDLDPGCFQNHPKQAGGMSTDWSRYASPPDTRNRGLRSGPADNAVLTLGVGAVREIPSQIVLHAPLQNDADLPDNRAPTEVL
jgi:hypothetical protein